MKKKTVQAFDIGIFPGDPTRGADHNGWMYSVRIGKQYVKSDFAYVELDDTAKAAVEHAVSLMMMQMEESNAGDG